MSLLTEYSAALQSYRYPSFDIYYASYFKDFHDTLQPFLDEVFLKLFASQIFQLLLSTLELNIGKAACIPLEITQLLRTEEPE